MCSFSPGGGAAGWQSAFDAFAMTPANITGAPINLTPVPPYLTLVSYMFLHANFWHLAGNMIFLWVFGDDIEEAMGPLRFIAFYFGSGIVGGPWPSPPPRRTRNCRWSAPPAPLPACWPLI